MAILLTGRSVSKAEIGSATVSQIKSELPQVMR